MLQPNTYGLHLKNREGGREGGRERAHLCWLHKHSADHIGAVGLVADSQAADNGSKVQPVIRADGTELELILTSTLNDGTVTDLHL